MLITEDVTSARLNHFEAFDKAIRGINPQYSFNARSMSIRHPAALKYPKTVYNDNVAVGDKPYEIAHHVGIAIPEKDLDSNGYHVHMYNPETKQLEYKGVHTPRRLFGPLRTNPGSPDTESDFRVTNELTKGIAPLPLGYFAHMHGALHDAINFPSAEHRDALHEYTLNSSPLNNYLMGKGSYVSTDREKMFNHITKHLSEVNSVTPRPISVYSGVRGLDLSHFVDPYAGVGAKFHHHAFISTSLDPRVAAHQFGISSSGAKRGSILKFNLPERFDRGVYIAPTSAYPTEREYLLHHDQNWRYKGTTSQMIRDPDWHDVPAKEGSITFDVHHFEPWK